MNTTTFNKNRLATAVANTVGMAKVDPNITTPSTTQKSWSIFAVDGGFYFFGSEVPAKEGYFALAEAAMFGGFGGEKGLPGVAKGHPEATVILDRFAPNEELIIPHDRVVFITAAVDLYKFKGTTIRD